MQRPVRVCIVSLGCSKNLVDTEVMCGSLAVNGYMLTSDMAHADVLLINTCSFVADARAEAQDEIRQALAWKRRGKGRRVVVSGCLPQRDVGEVRDGFPGVDLFLGLDDVPAVSERLNALVGDRGSGSGAARPAFAEATYLYDHLTPRLQLTPKNYAFVKIAEGCDHRCSFCAIPSIRGRQRSRAPASVVAECRNLLEGGTHELNLIAQDTTRYGADRDDGANLRALLQACDQLPGRKWVRVLYAHPSHLTLETLDVMAATPSVVPYLDIPLQHISQPILRSMGRGMGEDQTRELMAAVRQRWPGVAVRTAFLVGYPGETDADFERLAEFVRQYRFERLGVFAFSPERGTRALQAAGEPVPSELAAERRTRLLTLQQDISLAHNAALVGSGCEVLVEAEVEPGSFVGRTTADAPDVDQLVHFTGPDDCVSRGLVDVRIAAAEPYDLHGEVT